VNGGRRQLAEIRRACHRDRRDEAVLGRDQHNGVVHDHDGHFRRCPVGRHFLQIGEGIGSLVDDLDAELLLDDREDVGSEILGGAGRSADHHVPDVGANQRRHTDDRAGGGGGACLQKPTPG
jgi:hypothetical protein